MATFVFVFTFFNRTFNDGVFKKPTGVSTASTDATRSVRIKLFTSRFSSTGCTRSNRTPVLTQVTRRDVSCYTVRTNVLFHKNNT